MSAMFTYYKTNPTQRYEVVQLEDEDFADIVNDEAVKDLIACSPVYRNSAFEVWPKASENWITEIVENDHY